MKNLESLNSFLDERPLELSLEIFLSTILEKQNFAKIFVFDEITF